MQPDFGVFGDFGDLTISISHSCLVARYPMIDTIFIYSTLELK